MCAAILGRPPVLKDIVEEHFDELDFLWAQRESVIFAPDWNLEELAELEGRTEAHLDGLRLAELHALDIAMPQLAAEEPSAVSAATFVVMESGLAEPMEALLEALASASPAAVEGIRVGLRHSRIDPLERQLFALAESGDAGVRGAAFDVLAFHRRAVPAGLDGLLTAEDPHVRRIAWGAAGRVPGVIGGDHLEDALADAEADVRRAALEACARVGMQGLRERCHAAPTDPVVLAFLGVLGHPGDLSILTSALEKPDLAEAALSGLAALGLPGAVPAIITAMEQAPAAGAAFTRLTGIEDLGEPPPAEPPAEGPPDVEEDFADPESLPDVECVRALWDAEAPRFHPQRHWQGGLDVGDGPDGAAFHWISLQSRRDLVLRSCSVGRPPAWPPEIEATARAQWPRGPQTS